MRIARERRPGIGTECEAPGRRIGIMTIAAQPAGATPRDAGDGDVIRTVGLTKVFDGRGGPLRCLVAMTIVARIRGAERDGKIGPRDAKAVIMARIDDHVGARRHMA